MRARSGRADLIVAWRSGGAEAARDVAWRLGMSEARDQLTSEAIARRNDPGRVVEGGPSTPATSTGATSADADEQPPPGPVPIAYVTRREPRQREEVIDDDPRHVDFDTWRPQGSAPPSPEAVPARAIRAAIERLLGTRSRRVAPSLRELVRQVARCRPIDRLPRAVKPRPVKQLRLLADRSASLVPVWVDQERMIDGLSRRLGRDGLEVMSFAAGDPLAFPVTTRRIAPHAATLVVTGWACRETARDVLDSAIGIARRSGARGDVAVLAMGPRSDGLAAPVTYEVADTAIVDDARLESILGLVILEWFLSVPKFFEPGLLRELRLALELPDVGIGTEIALWERCEVQTRDLGEFDAPTRHHAQRELARVLEGPESTLEVLEADASRVAPLLPLGEAERRRIAHDVWDHVQRAGEALADLLPRWRADASEGYLHQDRLTLDGLYQLSGHASPVTRDSFAQARRFIAGNTASDDPEVMRVNRAWLRQFAEATPTDSPLHDPSRYGFLHDAWRDVEGHAGPVRWWIEQRGDKLVLSKSLGAVERQAGARVMGELHATESVVRVVTHRGARSYSLAGGAQHDVPDGSSKWITDLDEVTIEPFRPEPWMSAWGLAQGELGLWVEVGERSERIRFRWRAPFAGPEGEYELIPSTLPSWAARAGIDDFGAWVDVDVAGVSQRMRWVPPGEFLMGSPEDDTESFNDERPQHRVELTAGFWLAETPCTQDFYEAVTGKRPSRFEGARRPVKTVSWDDAQQMMRRLDELVPGFGARFPTEAEWEYACRAGTVQPRYREDLDEIVWYDGNSDGSTHDVAQKAANPWGFHDMLGNVYEWCADWRAGFPDSAVVDPTGPQSGDSRVLRGGSWWNDARYCRAAARNGRPPDNGDVLIGFRLSRGQRFRSGAQPSAAEPEAGRDARRRRGRRGPAGGDA